MSLENFRGSTDCPFKDTQHYIETDEGCPSCRKYYGDIPTPAEMIRVMEKMNCSCIEAYRALIKHKVVSKACEHFAEK